MLLPRIRPIFAVLLLASCVDTPARAQVYLDPLAPTADRVEDLLARMTLAEKVGQMTQAERASLSGDDIATYFLGSLLSGGGSAPTPNVPQAWTDMVDGFQQRALATRLGIPLIYGIDAVHGHNNVRGAVVFPHNIGLGATRNPDLVQEAGRITALEVAATGIQWTFAPAIPVVRDERWGRTYEGFGETAELAELLGAAAIRGLQTGGLGSPGAILATAKHYVGDGGTTGGDDQGNLQVSEAELRAIHLPGYVAALAAGAKCVMASYSSWNGAKLHGHRYLLTDVLKGELGFDGFVVSDWAGIDQLPGDYRSDVEQSILAGVDMVMVPDRYREFIATLVSLVGEGRVPLSRIDDAVRRILRVKFELGLFERPLADRSLLPLVGSSDHRAVAREAVRQSLVVLARKDGVLPIPASGARIHIAGRHRNDIGRQSGGWTISWQGSPGATTNGTTIEGAIRAAAPSAVITTSDDGSGAAGADVAIAVVGEDPYAEGAGDRADLHLSRSDVATVRSLKEAGLPVVLVLVSGRPMILDDVLPFTDAVIAAWLPGTEGDGVADILFGSKPPVGLLPHSWPRSMDQVPINVGDPGYDPLFAYGHGLTSLDDSPAGSPPVPYAARTTTDGLAVEVFFTKRIAGVPADGRGFAVDAGGPVTVTSAAVLPTDPTGVVLRLAQPVGGLAEVQVAFASGTVTAWDGGLLAPFDGLDAYNRAQGVPSLPGRIQAEDFVAMSGVQTESTTDAGGGINVGWIDAGDWMEYLVDVAVSGLYQVTYRVAAQSSSGRLDFRVGGQALAATDLPITGGWQTWTSVNTTVTLQSGVQTVHLRAVRGGFNVNWIDFSLLSGTAVEREVPGAGSVEVFPSPASDRATVAFDVERPGRVVMEIFDLLGRRVAAPVDGHYVPGAYRVPVDLSALAPGAYVFRLATGQVARGGPMVIVR